MGSIDAASLASIPADALHLLSPLRVLSIEVHLDADRATEQRRRGQQLLHLYRATVRKGNSKVAHLDYRAGVKVRHWGQVNFEQLCTQRP